MQTNVTLLRALRMCGTISPFYCCDNSLIKSFVNVYCPNTMRLGIFFSQKVSQSLDRSDYQCPQIKSTCQVRNTPCEEQINSFCWSLTEWFTFVNRWKTQVNMFLEICIVQHVQTENVHLLFWRKISANHNQAYISLCPKRQKKTVHFRHKCVDFPMAAKFTRKLIFCLILYTFNLQSSKMTFSVSNNTIEFFPDFGPGSVTLTVKKNVQGMTIGSQETSLTASSLFFSQRQDFLNNNWAWTPITANQQGTHEMKDMR